MNDSVWAVECSLMAERLAALSIYKARQILGQLQAVQEGQVLYFANGGIESNGQVSVAGFAQELITILRRFEIASDQVNQLEAFLLRHRRPDAFFVNLRGPTLTDFRVAVGKVQSVFATEVTRR